MTRNLTHRILTAGLSALLGTASLSAQSSREVADVPFIFHAGQQTFSAGKYEVRETNSVGLFRLTASDGRSIFVGATIPRTTDPQKPHLTFVGYGNEYVLSEISMPGKNVSYAASQSVIDKNLSRKIGVAALISVPLKGR
jgi:hypothetical protein